MTVVVLWQRPDTNQLWCMADTRVSADNEVVLTDAGPKILSIPVVCHKTRSAKKATDWHAYRRQSFGFAYAGSTLSALGTHAIASSFTQHLRDQDGSAPPTSVEDVARLYARVGEDYVRDAAGRVGAAGNPQTKFFDAMIFGYCMRTNRLRGFAIVSSLAGGEFHMNFAELQLGPGRFHPMGSGADAFLRLNNELRHTHPEPGVLTTFGELIRRRELPDVGGTAQVGICDRRDGFRVVPLIVPRDGGATLNFLGHEAGMVGDLSVGFSAVRINALE